MATLATLVVDLIAETASFKKGMDEAAAKMGDISRKIQDKGKQISSFGKTLSLGLTTPILGAGIASVKMASDVEESANAVNVVFGESAETIMKWGETSATQMGLATSEFYQLSAQSGAMLQNMGIEQVAAADESANLAQRAADMASIFNTDVNQALEAIQAGLRGEIDPLEKFGVKLNQSAIAAKAMEMGLAETTVDLVKMNGLLLDQEKAQNDLAYATRMWGEDSLNAREAAQKLAEVNQQIDKAMEGSTAQLSDSAKAQAALALIYEQTDKLAGDFVNTSDGLANSTRIAQAQVKNLAAAFGKDLLPYVLQGITYLRDLLDRFMTLDPEQRKTILTVAGLAAVIGPLLIILGSLITALGALFSPIGIIIVLVGLFAAAWHTNFGGIRDSLTELWTGTLQPIFTALVAWLQENLPVAIQFLSNLWQTRLLPSIKQVWNFFSKVFIPIIGAVADVLSAILGVAVTVLAGLWQNVLWPALQKVWELLIKYDPLFKNIVSIIENHVIPAFNVFMDFVINPLIQGFGGIVNAVQKVVSWLKTLANKIRSIKLPDWLTPGSPTPFEMGLRGIADALNVINRTQLPRLESNLGNLALAPIQASMTSAGISSGGGETHFHFHNVRIDDERDLTRRIRTTQILMEA